MENPEMEKKTGRPTIYSQELGDSICEQIANGKSLRTICKAEDMPCAATVFSWLRTNNIFLEQYERAKEESTNAHLDEIQELGDQAISHSQEVDPKASNAVVSAYKLKADNLKWVMSKLKPKKYGDKIDMTTNGKDLPTPILGNALLSNDSNKENSESNQTN